MLKQNTFVFLTILSLLSISSSLVEQTATSSQAGTNDYIADESNLVWPFSASSSQNDYPFSSTFGPRLQASNNYAFDFHRGIDIPRSNGTHLYAVQDGLVFRNRTSASGDHYIALKVQHTSGARSAQGYRYYYPTYRHLNHSYVSEGDYVTKGQLIALSGESASGFDHLHFDIAVGSLYEIRNTHPLIYLDYPNTGIPEISKSNPNNPYFSGSSKTVSFNVTVSSTQLDLIQVSVSGLINNVQYEGIFNFQVINLLTVNKSDLDNAIQTLPNGVIVTIGLTHHNAQSTNKVYSFDFDFSNLVPSTVSSYSMAITAKDVRDGYETVTITA